MHQENEATKPEETQPAENAASSQIEDKVPDSESDADTSVTPPADNAEVAEAPSSEESESENSGTKEDDSSEIAGIGDDAAAPEQAAEEAAPEASGDATDTSTEKSEDEEAAEDEAAAVESAAAEAESEEKAEEATIAEAAVVETAAVEAATSEETATSAVEAPAAEAEPSTEDQGQADKPASAEDSGDDQVEDEDYNPAAAQNTIEEDDEMDAESFEALLEQYDQQFREFRPGDLVEGTVVSLGEQEVLLDIGARVEGNIPASELKGEDGEFSVTDGDKIKVMVCRFNPDAQYIPLSYERARVSQVWDHIEEVASKEKMLKGTVIEKVKGGFIVDVGVRAFLPTSQASLRPQKDMQDLLGQEMEFTILKIQRRRGNLILSRREILEEEMKSMRGELFEKLQEGAVLDGSVKNITDYGVFIDLGGLDGLLHITDMSWGRVSHPKDLVELGQELQVKVLRFDREKEKVSLGLKQCTPDPWLSASEKYPPGTNAKGKVLNLTSYGSFIELEPGVEGMIHVSEMSWTKKIRNPAQILTKGQEVESRVLDIDTENRRVSLSLKQCEDNPWESLAERFPVGSKVSGKVRNITEFGAFIEIEDGIDGLVHVSDFAWGERNATPTEYVKKGEEVEVVILAVDTDNHKVSLGMKQLTPDPWIDFTNQYHSDQIVNVPISKVTEFGVFLRLTDHVEGLIRNNELNLEHGKKASDIFEEDQVIQALITRINNRERKVDLSIRRLSQHQERQAVREYTKKTDTGGATLGDIADLKKLIR